MPLVSILTHILVAEPGKASKIQIENLGRDFNVMGLERSLHFQLKVPMVRGEYVVSPPQLMNNIPVHLFLHRDNKMELLLYTCPARITAVSIHMLWKREISCNGLKILEDDRDFLFEKTDADFGDQISLEVSGQHSDPITGVLDVRMSDISFKCVENQKFEVLEFELNPRNVRPVNYDSWRDLEVLIGRTLSPMKYLHKLKFHLDFAKIVLSYAEKKSETYVIGIPSPGFAGNCKNNLSCCVLISFFLQRKKSVVTFINN